MAPFRPISRNASGRCCGNDGGCRLSDGSRTGGRDSGCRGAAWAGGDERGGWTIGRGAGGVAGERGLDLEERPGDVGATADGAVCEGQGGGGSLGQVAVRRGGGGRRESGQLAGEGLAGILLRLLGGAADVRGENDILQVAQL